MYSKVKRSIWKEKWFLNLSPKAKLLYMYLSTSNRIGSLGVIYVSLDDIEKETGLGKRTILRAIEELKDYVYYDRKKNLFYLRGYISIQGNTKNSRYVNSILLELDKLSEEDIERLVGFDCELRQFLEVSGRVCLETKEKSPSSDVSSVRDTDKGNTETSHSDVTSVKSCDKNELETPSLASTSVKNRDKSEPETPHSYATPVKNCDRSECVTRSLSVTSVTNLENLSQILTKLHNEKSQRSNLLEPLGATFDSSKIP
ncbi:MAG: helix-turn-helix domain-containing protein, partial [Nitrososphaerota archaeon]